MRYLLSLIFCVLSFIVSSQPLRDINYNYLYNPAESFTLDLKAIRYTDSWRIFYKFLLRDTAVIEEQYAIQWETRESLSYKENIPLSSSIVIKETTRDKTGFTGYVEIPITAAPKIFLAKVVNNAIKRAWIFYKHLEPDYPVVNYLTRNNEIAFKPYVGVSNRVSVAGSDSWTVSYYEDNFPAASPPFSEAQAKVSKGIKTDSTFFISRGQEITLPLTGLYLIQRDTNSTEGVAFRVEDDYPRLAKIQSLAGPLMYICTKQEFDRLVLAKNDKKAFDRVVLSMTADTERARKFMRSYFRRVELANQYFTSYKEGWKTDRGMIYIIFGLPDEVYKFNDREVWEYKNDSYTVTFNFSKSSSIFDPDNYVLIREKKYQQTWYEVIDLWRNARF